METRRLTRSQAAQLGLTPTKEVFLESAKKPSARKSTRKPLADRTNEKDDSPVSGFAAPKGGNRCVFEGTPLSKLRPLAETPGEDVLRSQVQSKLSESSEDVSSPDIQSFFKGGLSTLTPACPAPPTLRQNAAPMLVGPVIEDEPSTALPPAAKHLCLAKTVTEAADEPEVTSAAAALPPACTEDRQVREQNSSQLFMFAKAPENLATVEEEESEICVIDPKEDAKETQAIGDAESPSAPKTANPVPAPSLTESSDWAVRAIENMESCDEDVPECFSDDVSECSEVVNPEPTGDASSSRPAQWRQRRSPQKVKFEEDPASDAGEEYGDFGEESLEYEGGPYDKACDDLCRGLSGISMHERNGVGLPEFSGTHVRFNYNSDDEMEEEEGEEEEVRKEEPLSPKRSPIMAALMRFKGLPTPKGKHLRFAKDADSPAR